MKSHSYDSAPSHLLRNLLVVLVAAAIVVVGYAWLRGSAPRISTDAPTAIGAQKLVGFDIESSAGVADVEAHYVQKGKTIPLGRQTFAPRRWFTTGDSPVVVHFAVQAGQTSHPELQDGPAQLVVTAESANLRGASTTLTRAVQVQTHPPAVYSLSSQQYVNQGGSEMVVYHVSKSVAESGVEMGGIFFKGYALPNAAPGTMFCLFAFPWNAPADSQPQLIARDAAGNQATASFPVKTFPKTFRSRTLEISDNFIEQVVMPIIAHMPELHDQHDPLKNFLMVNRDLRRTETQQLVDAASQTTPRFLWQGAFVQLGNSAVEANFADQRTYTYHGQVVDHETHLGFDLAALRHTPVKAANAGRVVWAKYFGIYGNCILLDHGYGLMSLYAHLNDFQVQPGEMVSKGQLIAHSDSTGLAGGDHLHFSMLLDGQQINPMEWWDAHWVHDRIERKLAEYSTVAARPANAPVHP